ncbi:2-oxoacid:ferredoxin oxidoreductase subunit alpha [Candidatus Bathycorpusculum sp.]|uniref:2-oxoacid:ferredoxin oxidoreductase subunit alpha n=1 Tax=Candidatus Bathycorpusculum sp. TaxID=2994959 RepID=UPI00281D1A9E|nr:2-oxoacid:acceptor oxidoreductase subunit alpha [Candidatus Termitimicrobium sp.]MCL2686695.1 2-oxoacid:acceptor oxidoreductase subunit alpha [Candidatus Termitimicrobium sp.]
MVIDSINWMAGGPQGSGVDTASAIFGKACGYGGNYVFGRREYHSNIKTMHSYFHQRLSKQPIEANIADVDLLAAFDAETVVRHVSEIVNEGGLIVDSRDLSVNTLQDIKTFSEEYKNQIRDFQKENGVGETISDYLNYAKQRRIQVYAISYMELLKEIGKKTGIENLGTLSKMINVLTIGVSFALLKYDRKLVENAIKATFHEKIVDMNLTALNHAYDYTENTFDVKGFKYKLERHPINEQRIFLTGNQAVAMGKVLGGCRMQTYYPITPAADESEYIEAHEILKTKTGNQEAVIVLQTEDEIAAVNSASGACLAGARAATSTSGPGFSLMVEGLGWAGNNEVPLVITYYQRGGPSTGQPTRHSQQDLRFAIHAAHGEFARIIVASGDIEECFFDAAEVFNLAEKYQMPTIHLIDKGMANSSQTYATFDYSKVKIDRGLIVGKKELEDKDYKRFEFSENGISPRAFLGTKNAIQWYSGDEHNERGNINEEPLNRRKMMDKRIGKLEVVNREVPMEFRAKFFGDKDAENIVVSWGSTKGAIIESLNQLREENKSLGYLQIRMIHPFPSAYIKQILSDKKRIIDIENNHMAQLGGIIAEQTQIQPSHYILKYTGRPMMTTEVYGAILAVLEDRAPQRQVLMLGA